jgi:Na+-transporting methylmalonyl-CoA/oxaloacetate decarboxylase gamma subunit
MPDLTGSVALDVAVGLAFVFLVLSLLASAIQEQIAAWLALRASTLEQGLRNMLENDAPAPLNATVPAATQNAEQRALVDELYAHPVIRSLYKQGRFLLRRKSKRTGPWEFGRLPSYIAPRSFALALMDTLAPNALASESGSPLTSRDALAEIRTAIGDTQLPPGLKHQLLTMVDGARGEIDDFRKGLEAWFDDSMARVSGWYKRKTQMFMLAIAIALALGLNANALTIGDRLWKDQAVRAAVVQAAGKATQEKKSLDEAADAVDSVKKLGVPLGWSRDASDARHVDFGEKFPKGALTVLGGWLLTIVAIMLGAPFWFDALSRLARLRNTGKPETPLPASGSGNPRERIVTEIPPVQVTLHAGAPENGSNAQ